MNNAPFVSLSEIEQIVCDIVVTDLGRPRSKVKPSSRLIQDLYCDSLEVVELMFLLEDRFDVTLEYRGEEAFCKSIFTRGDLRLSDLAEMIYIQRGTGKPVRSRSWNRAKTPVIRRDLPFCQLDGCWNPQPMEPLFEFVSDDGPTPLFRRRSDGMRCLLIPAARVEIGTDDTAFDSDSRPQHSVDLDPFLIDAEVVSNAAYCRFLNSIGDVPHNTLRDWFLLDETDHRNAHLLIRQQGRVWQPVPGTERQPMILVSWYGANAYSLWANQQDWQSSRGDEAGHPLSYLPSEAQWEYAARGAAYQTYPCGLLDHPDESLYCAQHQVGDSYTAESLPLRDVNLPFALSPFGLHQMAGHVWQWCRDWYDPSYYTQPSSRERNAWNSHKTGIRAERGGSWVGPAELCRSSYRRGRDPIARGRCLGFRCVSDVHVAQKARSSK